MELTQLNRNFPSKRAFITGAGSGLGAAFSKLLAKNGWALHLSDLNPSALQETIHSLDGVQSIHVYELDVSDHTAYENVKDEVLAQSSGIDLLINNAGIGDGGFFHEYGKEDWERMIHVNLMGTYYGCQLFVPSMVAAKSGLIINVGSAAGFMNAPGMTAYNVSKAAVYSLSETLLHELKSKNIHVTVLTPTFFKTNVMQYATGSAAFRSFAEKQMKYSKTNADEVAAVTLVGASKRKFQIIHPSDARRNHFFKKWFPKLVSKQFDKMMEKFGRG